MAAITRTHRQKHCGLNPLGPTSERLLGIRLPVVGSRSRLPFIVSLFCAAHHNRKSRRSNSRRGAIVHADHDILAGELHTARDYRGVGTSIRSQRRTLRLDTDIDA